MSSRKFSLNKRIIRTKKKLEKTLRDFSKLISNVRISYENP